MLPYLITYLCLNLDPKYNGACNNALTAASIQTHLKQNVDLLQQNIETEVEKRTNKKILGMGLGFYKMYTTETIVFSSDFKPISDGISASINKDTANLSLTWVF